MWIKLKKLCEVINCNTCTFNCVVVTIVHHTFMTVIFCKEFLALFSEIFKVFSVFISGTTMLLIFLSQNIWSKQRLHHLVVVLRHLSKWSWDGARESASILMDGGVLKSTKAYQMCMWLVLLKRRGGQVDCLSQILTESSIAASSEVWAVSSSEVARNQMFLNNCYCPNPSISLLSSFLPVGIWSHTTTLKNCYCPAHHIWIETSFLIVGVVVVVVLLLSDGGGRLVCTVGPKKCLIW